VFRPSRGPLPYSFPSRPLSLSSLGLSLLASPAHPLGLASHVSVAPCPIAASLTGKCLTSCHLRPSPCPADRWVPPIITFLRLYPSTVAPPPHPTTSGHHLAPRNAAPMPLHPHPHHQSLPLNPSLSHPAFSGIKAITTSDGGVCVSQLSAKSLNLMLSG
jgi:hypothetical protein